MLTMSPPLTPSRSADLLTIARLLSALAAPSPVPLGRWAEHVARHYRSIGASPSTRLRSAQAVREAIGLLPPGSTTADLTPELAREFAAASIPRHAPGTTNGLLRALRAACNLRPPEGQGAWIAGDPVGTAKCWRPEEPKRRHHSRKDIARLLAHLKEGSGDWEGLRLYALASVWAYTGLRRNEALRLKVDDVDLVQGFLWVRHGRQPRGQCKTPRSAAPVPIPKALAAILRAWLRKVGSEWLFPGTKKLGPWTGGTTGRRASDRLKAAGEAAGLKGLTPHSLRHSLATHLRGHWGLSRPHVQSILRHAWQTTQEGYVGEELIDLAALVRDFDFEAKAPRRRKPRRRG